MRQYEKTTGKKLEILHSEDDEDELYDELMHLFVLFREISLGRQYSMSGPNPITWTDFVAWQELSGIKLSVWELGLMKKLDLIWIDSTMKSMKKKK